MLSKSEVIERVRDITQSFDCNNYWVCAGAALVLHGVKQYTNDIDIGCTTEIFECLKKDYEVSYASNGMRKIVCNGVIEFFENWFVDDSILIDGICMGTLNSIKKQKYELGREKDFNDIKLIDEFLGI